MLDSEKRFWTFPNALSLFRIALIPLFVWCFFSRFEHHRVWAIAVFLCAGATDVIDGYIARHFHQTSLWGRILDPLADKLIIFTALICLSLTSILPFWLVLLYLSKELAQTACSMLFIHRTRNMLASNLLGKSGTALFYITIVTLTLFQPSRPLQNTLLILSYATITAAFFSYLLQGLGQDRLNHPTSEE